MILKRLAFVGAAALVLGLVAYQYGDTLLGASRAAPTPAKGIASRPRAVPVVAATVERRAIDVNLNVIGTVQPYSTVDIRSRVDGQLLTAHFREGQSVRKGERLFSIDPRPYEAQLRQSEAILAKDRAQLVRARADLARHTELMQKDFSSQQKLDEVKANAAALEATVRAGEATIEMARLQLEHTSILAPIDGRTGNLLINPGNLVKANEGSAIVVINQTRPIYAAFSVAEQYLPEIRRQMAAGGLRVSAFVPSEPERPERGAVTFVNNAVDRTTGTIQLKATLDNADGRLVPGQFVNVVLTRTTIPDAIVVPSQAIQNSQEGTYVFVIKPDLSVEQRTVTTGPTSQLLTVVEKGLAAGERVVTEGQLRLSVGARVEIKAGS